jgi:hypothetical protein
MQMSVKNAELAESRAAAAQAEADDFQQRGSAAEERLRTLEQSLHHVETLASQACTACFANWCRVVRCYCAWC